MIPPELSGLPFDMPDNTAVTLYATDGLVMVHEHGPYCDQSGPLTHAGVQAIDQMDDDEYDRWCLDGYPADDQPDPTAEQVAAWIRWFDAADGRRFNATD